MLRGRLGLMNWLAGFTWSFRVVAVLRRGLRSYLEESSLRARIGHNKAAVELANKLVRICLAVWCHERRFSGNWQSSRPA